MEKLGNGSTQSSHVKVKPPCYMVLWRSSGHAANLSTAHVREKIEPLSKIKGILVLIHADIYGDSECESLSVKALETRMRAYRSKMH